MINCIVATEKKARVVFLEGLLHFALVLLVCLFALVCVYGSFQGPVDYWQGLNRVYGNHDPRYALFMNGAFRVDGFWLYYPFCLLVKVPLPTILIFLLAIPSWWILRVKQKSFYFHLFFPIFLLLGAGALARHNIGVRHMLPIFPMLFVLAGGVGKFFKPLWTAALMPVFLVWLLLENIKIYPDYMAYFNQGAGGAKNGIHLLDDSNLDWGQDLKRLPALLQNLEIEDFRLAYFGGDHAAYRGMNPKDIRILDLYFPEGDYVVSANILRRNTIDPQYHGYGYDWLERFSPAAVLGHSLYVYRIRVGDAEGFRNGINYISAMQWRQQGFSRLKKLIAENPNFGEAQETLRFAENVFLN